MQNHGETTQHTVSTRWLLSGDGSAPILLHMLPGLPTILVKTAAREHWRSCYRAYIVSLTQINSYKNFLEQRLASLPSFLSPFFFSVIFITTWHILTLHLFAILSRGQKLHKNRDLSFFFFAPYSITWNSVWHSMYICWKNECWLCSKQPVTATVPQYLSHEQRGPAPPHPPCTSIPEIHLLLELPWLETDTNALKLEY